VAEALETLFSLVGVLVFAVIFRSDATLFGKRSVMAEVAVYTVAGGRIVREEFFY
jgi:hypothetical protein